MVLEHCVRLEHLWCLYGILFGGSPDYDGYIVKEGE